MSNLADLINRVEMLIADSANATFSTDAVTEGLRQALDRYSTARPLSAIGTVTVSAAGREIDISELTGLIEVSRVWTPYTAADPEHPPNWRGFEYWPDVNLLYFPDDDEPDTGDVIRIFYLKRQTIEDLDSATETTFPDKDESLIVSGAAGYTVLPRGRSSTEQVMLSDQTPLSKQITDWARQQLDLFQTGLDRIVKQQIALGNPIAKLDKLDRWDEWGKGWI